jgi:cob(I)alamin adenosyltransferase
MSIITKTGDDGTTGLMYNRRVSKSDPRVEAYGAVDELNSALGMAKAAGLGSLRERVETVQAELVAVMGELALLPQDAERYQKDGYATLSPQMIERLEAWAADVESKGLSFKGWATPGANAAAAALDLARGICRRAERNAWALKSEDALSNNEIPIYLNRLSDLLWLWAREIVQ